VLAKTHDLQLYIEHVKKAVEIDPDYLPALRNLGVAYLKTGQNEKAIAAFDEALKRDPHSALTYAASSAAYLGLQNYSGAETAARRALQIDSALEVCRYYLGVSLQLQHKNDAEALELLSKVAHDYPKAHLSAAEILERTGHKDDAKGQLNAYLKSGETDVRAEVKTWLSSLN
jgi:tetratricopeptide (TPR) repeat protein